MNEIKKNETLRFLDFGLELEAHYYEYNGEYDSEEAEQDFTGIIVHIDSNYLIAETESRLMAGTRKSYVEFIVVRNNDYLTVVKVCDSIEEAMESIL